MANMNPKETWNGYVSDKIYFVARNIIRSSRDIP